MPVRSVPAWDFVERRNTVRGFELGEERIAFRLVGTGVHQLAAKIRILL